MCSLARGSQRTKTKDYARTLPCHDWLEPSTHPLRAIGSAPFDSKSTADWRPSENTGKRACARHCDKARIKQRRQQERCALQPRFQHLDLMWLWHQETRLTAHRAKTSSSPRGRRQNKKSSHHSDSASYASSEATTQSDQTTQERAGVCQQLQPEKKAAATIQKRDHRLASQLRLCNINNYFMFPIL
jgi:hypothetical protein